MSTILLFSQQIVKGTKSGNIQSTSNLAQHDSREQLHQLKPVMGCAAKRKSAEYATSDAQAAINEKRLKSFQQKAEQMRQHCKQLKRESVETRRSKKRVNDSNKIKGMTTHVIDRAVSQTVSEAFLSCELSSMDASVTFMEEPASCHKATVREFSSLGGGVTFMEESMTCHRAKAVEDQSIHCNTLSELSTIHMLSDRECTVREQNSCYDAVDGPLHSSIRYPQFSTPTQNPNLDAPCTIQPNSESVEDLVFHDITLIPDNCDQECRSASLNVTVTLSKDSVIRQQNELPAAMENECTLDSDNTTFMKAPLCKKAVTYKIKSSRKAAVKKQLKTFGRQIKTLGAGHSRMQTLAVL